MRTPPLVDYRVMPNDIARMLDTYKSAEEE